MLYKFFIRIGKKDIPERKAIVVLALWDSFYLMIAFSLLRYLTNRELLVPKWIVGSVFIVIVLIHFVSFIYNNRYLRIYRQFEKEVSLRDKYGAVIVVAYLLIPMFALVIFAVTIWR